MPGLTSSSKNYGSPDYGSAFKPSFAGKTPSYGTPGQGDNEGLFDDIIGTIDPLKLRNLLPASQATKTGAELDAFTVGLRDNASPTPDQQTLAESSGGSGGNTAVGLAIGVIGTMVAKKLIGRSAAAKLSAKLAAEGEPAAMSFMQRLRAAGGAFMGKTAPAAAEAGAAAKGTVAEAFGAGTAAAMKSAPAATEAVKEVAKKGLASKVLKGGALGLSAAAAATLAIPAVKYVGEEYFGKKWTRIPKYDDKGNKVGQEWGTSEDREEAKTMGALKAQKAMKMDEINADRAYQEEQLRKESQRQLQVAILQRATQLDNARSAAVQAFMDRYDATQQNYSKSIEQILIGQ